MKLLIDYYKPNSLDELDFSFDVNQKLKKLATIDNMPHLLLSGNYGSGKKLRTLLFLKAKYGDFKIHNTTLTSDSVEPMNMLTSQYHHQFDLSIHNIHDRILLQTFIDEVVKYKAINSFISKKNDANSNSIIPSYRIVILENADKLTKEAQQALRRTLETRIENCRFIFLVNKVGLLIDPLYSRCVKINCPSPTNLEIEQIISKLLNKLNIKFNPLYLKDLIQASNRNLNLALHYTDRANQLNLLNTPCGTNTTFSLIPIDEVEEIISKLVKLIIAGQDLKIFSEEYVSKKEISVRKYLYDLLVDNISATDILHRIFLCTLQQIPRSEIKYIYEICELTSKYDNSLRLGSKVMYHLEAYLLCLFRIIKLMISERNKNKK